LKIAARRANAPSWKAAQNTLRLVEALAVEFGNRIAVIYSFSERYLGVPSVPT